MFIKSMKISNFQCFSEVPVDIDFEKDITCLIGNNGAGKTSILKAIQKVFGNTTDERTIFKSDFHVATGETDLQNRQLPENKDEEDYKYLNQAVLSHPEIYFSKLVVLGEGDSEEIVLPVIAQKKSCNFDTSFVSFVPLAGRHVNHMWRLLNELKIPYVTLLDYDLGRYGGGEKRLFEISEKLGLPKTSTKEILEEHSVFFSYPLDFDMLMINAFPDFYKNNGQNDEHDELVKAVLGKKGDETKYVSPNKFFTDEVLRKYRYLFKTKSKVASHYLICDKIKEMGQSDFEQKCPTVLHRLINKACDILKKSQFQ